MKNAIRYFKHLLKTNTRAFIIITVITLLSCSVAVSESQYLYRYQKVDDGYGGYYTYSERYEKDPYDGEHWQPDYYGINYWWLEDSVESDPSVGYTYSYRLYLDYASGLMLALCFLAPIWFFSGFKKRRNLDTVYSLPIGRRALGGVHYLAGLLSIWIPVTVSYMFTVITALADGASAYINFGWLILHFVSTLLCGWLLYSFYLFFYCEGNSVGDGCVFMLSWTVLPYWICEFMDILGGASELVPPVFANDLLSALKAGIEIDNKVVSGFFAQSKNIVLLLVWLAVGIGITALFFYRFRSKHTEKAGAVSDSLVGYSLIIPLFIIPTVIHTTYDYGTKGWTLNIENEPGAVLLGLAAAFIAYTIFRRGVRYKKSDWCVLGVIGFFFLISCAI